MSKIYKMTAYLVDPNEHYKDVEDWFFRAIDGTEMYCPRPIEWEGIEFEWDDNLPINFIGCTKEDCEKYFE